MRSAVQLSGNDFSGALSMLSRQLPKCRLQQRLQRLHVDVAGDEDLRVRRSQPAPVEGLQVLRASSDWIDASVPEPVNGIA
jgi:hypothetical protein